MRRLATRACVLALLAPLAACAIVHVHAPGKDDVQVTRGFGMVSVQAKPGAGAVVVDSVAFGVVDGFDGLSLGYRSVTGAVVARGSCQLVVWVKSDGELKELKELLQDRTDVCAVRPVYSTGGTP
jgi:hypothetical protein